VSFRFVVKMATTGVRAAALSLGALAGGPRVVHATAISLFRTAGACARAARHRPPSTPFLAVVGVDLGAAGRARPERSERKRAEVMFQSFISYMSLSPRGVCSRGGAWGGEHRAGAPDGARGASDAHHQDAVARS
jgi:hypothetical protein